MDNVAAPPARSAPRPPGASLPHTGVKGRSRLAARASYRRLDQWVFSLRYGKASSVALADERRNSADGGSTGRSRGCAATRFYGGMEICTGRRVDRCGVRLSLVDVDHRFADGRRSDARSVGTLNHV